MSVDAWQQYIISLGMIWELKDYDEIVNEQSKIKMVESEKNREDEMEKRVNRDRFVDGEDGRCWLRKG